MVGPIPVPVRDPEFWLDLQRGKELSNLGCPKPLLPRGSSNTHPLWLMVWPKRLFTCVVPLCYVF